MSEITSKEAIIPRRSTTIIFGKEAETMPYKRGTGSELEMVNFVREVLFRYGRATLTALAGNTDSETAEKVKSLLPKGRFNLYRDGNYDKFLLLPWNVDRKYLTLTRREHRLRKARRILEKHFAAKLANLEMQPTEVSVQEAPFDETSGGVIQTLRAGLSFKTQGQDVLLMILPEQLKNNIQLCIAPGYQHDPDNPKLFNRLEDAAAYIKKGES